MTTHAHRPVPNTRNSKTGPLLTGIRACCGRLALTYFIILLLTPLSLRAEPATIEGATLILPVVKVGEAGYYVELTLLDNTDPPELTLTGGDLLSNPDFTGASIFADGVLTVPSINVDGTLLWAQFALVNDNPVVFRLLAANFDDLDDDDDGIPDSEDEFPYTPAEEVVILPVVMVDNLRFYLELTVVADTDPVELLFAAAELLDNPDTSNASFFANGVLTIPSIEIGGISYWRRFTLVDTDPIRFRLLDEGLDDLDDDDDGIPDNEDEFPYTPAENDPAGIAGSWTFYFTIDPASQVEDTACESDPISTDHQAQIFWDASTGYSINAPLYFLPLTVTGNTVSWSASYEEESGLTQSAVTMNILSDVEMTGDETWTWSAEGEVTCLNIHSSVSALRN